MVVPALTVVLSLGAGVAGGTLVRDDTPATTATTTADPVSMTLAGDTLDVAAVLDRLEASVVSIQTSIVSRRGPMEVEGEGAGPGIVLDEEGDILTNAHVVADATEIYVTVPGDPDPRPATLVASRASSDIAVLHLEDTTDLVAATLAAAGATAVGDDVVAIGNALALEGGLSVTQGIISALDREIGTESGTLSGLIQTDAAISSGNSGGPLVNARGEVVGINTAVASSSSGVQASNIGFAIDINQALAVAEGILGRPV
jgi:putative serine protease PepD